MKADLMVLESNVTLTVAGALLAALLAGCATLPEASDGREEPASCLQIRPLPRSDVRSKL